MAQLLLDKDQALKCGMGEGADCCAYLMLGENGIECGRVTSFGATLYIKAVSGQMKACRVPEGEFPACQDEARST